MWARFEIYKIDSSKNKIFNFENYKVNYLNIFLIKNINNYYHNLVYERRHKEEIERLLNDYDK